jgi:hypothetical protein
MPTSVRHLLAENPVLSLVLFAAAVIATSHTGSAQTVELRDAPEANMPAPVDSNSPAYWLNGELRLINSTGNGPYLSHGRDQFHEAGAQKISLATRAQMPTWLEAVWMDSTGILFGWYHQEDHTACPGKDLAVPRIGAAISYDGGSKFLDLGVVLASGDPIDCASQNGYFAGGHGDFSVVPDRSGTFFYFLFTNYAGPRKSQGIVIARMAFADRFNPAGHVWKYFEGAWDQPGISGGVTPIFPARIGWQRADTNSYWGPAVHWNTYLGSYVMLLNHSCCTPGWPQKDVRVTFNADLANPSAWSTPQVLVDGGAWYPQVLGTGPEGTDSEAGRFPRLYMYGRSTARMVFHKPGEAAAPSADGSH